jgi:hypothetical protein
MPYRISYQTFCVCEVFHKTLIFNVNFVNNVRAINLLGKSSGLQENHPLPPQCCAWGR